MFDLSSVSKRYFKIRLGETELSVEPPRLKVLKQLTSGAQNAEDGITVLTEALSKILSKNKTGTPVTADFIEETFDLDDMNRILTSYFEWLKEVHGEKN